MSPSPQTPGRMVGALAQALVEDGYATEADVAPLLDEATNRPVPGHLAHRRGTWHFLGWSSERWPSWPSCPAVDLAAMTPSPEALAVMPDAVAREYGAVGRQSTGTC